MTRTTGARTFAERYATGQIDRHRLVSFDIFDTLVSRRVTHPTHVFDLVRLQLSGRVPASLAAIVDAFPEMRVRAERSARAAAPDDHNGEVSLREVYKTFGAMQSLGAEHLRTFYEAELAMERRVTYANPIGKRLFAYARAQGKTVVLTSDMYLPLHDIEEILERCGYRGYDEIYVSHVARASKHHGSLFAYIDASRPQAVAKSLHIGDNIRGDYHMPLAAGWSAAHLPVAPVRTTGAAHDDLDAARGNVVRSIVDGLLGEHETVESDGVDPWETLGFDVFGPMLAGFLIWLASNVRSRDPDKILFLARDAYFVREQLPKFLSRGRDDAYVYASRGSVLLPSFTDFPLARLVHLVSGRTRVSVGRHLRRLGLEPETHVSVVRSVGFDGIDDLAENGDARMVALLAKLHAPLLRVAASRRGLARGYLERCVGDAKRIAIVDIGWTGNIQGAIRRLLATGRDDVCIDGYYVGLLPEATKNLEADHTMRAWLEATFTGDTAALWWSGGVEILEFAMSAPHGTTLAYEETESGIAPVLAENDSSADEIAKLERLQAGASRFIDNVVDTFGDMVVALDSPAWADRFFRLVGQPTAEEAQLLGDITHGDVAGDTSIRFPLAPPWSPAGGNASRYSRCCWKRGFIARNAPASDAGYSEELYLELYEDVRAAVASGAMASGRAHYDEHGRREDRVASWAQM